MFVRFCREVRSAFQRKMVNGRVHWPSQSDGHFMPGRMQTYDLAFCAMILLQHLYVGILRKAVLTHGRKVRGLPSGAVKIVLDLGRHLGLALVERTEAKDRTRQSRGGGVCG